MFIIIVDSIEPIEISNIILSNVTALTYIMKDIEG